jgi:hypothetical protein
MRFSCHTIAGQKVHEGKNAQKKARLTANMPFHLQTAFLDN